MSIYTKNILPTCKIAEETKSKLSKEQLEIVKRGLSHCGFFLLDISTMQLKEEEITKGLHKLWAGRPTKSIWKLVAFGNELWACDFRISFQSVMVPSRPNGKKSTMVSSPKCIFCRTTIDTKKPPGDHIYDQKCLVKWVKHIVDDSNEDI